MNTDVYKPIDCDFYDTLEVLAMRHKECVLEYLDEQQQSQTIRTVIVDVFAKGAEEFILLESGKWIRLDQLLVVDQRPFPLVSCPTGHAAGQLKRVGSFD
jgi:transcriptional antiterminator Rof (Rho-off)